MWSERTLRGSSAPDYVATSSELAVKSVLTIHRTRAGTTRTARGHVKKSRYCTRPWLGTIHAVQYQPDVEAYISYVL